MATHDAEQFLLNGTIVNVTDKTLTLPNNADDFFRIWQKITDSYYNTSPTFSGPPFMVPVSMLSFLGDFMVRVIYYLPL